MVKRKVTSTLHICWGAQAGLYYHFGLDKVLLPQKLFGIYEHKVMNRKIPLVRGFDDYFLIPHSRHTAIPADAIHGCRELLVLAESEEAGVLLCMAGEGKQIFVMGHPEYDRMTLHNEYVRDKERDFPSIYRRTIILIMTLRNARSCNGVPTAIICIPTG